jgi:hypothetical protein
MRAGGAAFVKSGHGYWDVTHYPRGGAFRRVPVDGPVPCTLVRVGATYADGSPREWYVKLSDGSDACVGAADMSQ